MSKANIALSICELLAEQQNLGATLMNSAKGAGIIGLASFLGGLLGGKKGLAIGAVVGSAGSMMLTSDFKSVVQILRHEMTAEQRRELGNRVGKLFRGFQITDAASGVALLMQNSDLKKAVVGQIGDYFKTELHMDIV